MAQSVFENRFLADACHNVWEIWDKGRAYRLNLAQMAHEAGGHCQDECLNTLWAACMRSAGFFCAVCMERMRLELNGGILYADLETCCFFAALV